MPEERLQAKIRMKQFNDLYPADFEGRANLINEIFREPTEAWVEPPFYFCYGKHISLGKGSYINVNCNFIDDGEIVIGAGSVVIHDVPENCIAAGNPARVIRQIDERDQKYYYKDRMIDAEDLKEEARLRQG